MNFLALSVLYNRLQMQPFNGREWVIFFLNKIYIVLGFENRGLELETLLFIVYFFH